MVGSRRILCIGLDGATFSVLTPWMDDGTLPNLAAIRAAGVWGPLASTVPPLTAPAWTSFMTGRNPGNHGVFHFLDLSDHAAHARGERQLGDLDPSKSPAIWDILAHEGGRVGLINLPMTYPPRPVNGFMISGMMTPPGAPFTHPAELAERLPNYRIDIGRFNGQTPFSRDLDDGHAIDDVDGLIREYDDLLVLRGNTANRLLRQEPWDFFMVVFIGTDRLGHYAWTYHPSAFQKNGSALSLDRHAAVERYYRHLDEIIGELIAGAGPEAVTIIMSDHGMGPSWTRHVHVNGWLFQRGLLALDGSRRPSASADRWLLHLGVPRDRLSQLVHALPIPKKLVRRAAKAGGRLPIDPENSQAFFLPIYNHVGGIHLNQSLADDSAKRLRDDIIADLGQLTDPATGKLIFRQVHPREAFYQGIFASTMPEIITIAHPEYAGSMRISHFTGITTERREIEIPGAHRDDGIFLAAGPGIRHQAEPLEQLSIEDLAPTMLYLLDCPVPEELDGRVLHQALLPDLLSTSPVRYATATNVGRWTDGSQPLVGNTTAADDQRVLEHLRALGYL